MNVISMDGARVNMTFVSDEVKPLKGIHLPAVLNAVSAKYEAAKSPTLDEARSVGAKFQNCRFVTGNKEITIVELGLFNDGIYATTTDTSDSEIVLIDLFEWLKKKFHFRDPVTPALRVYQSDLVVRFDNDPTAAFSRIGPFLEFIQAYITPKTTMKLGGIIFGVDPIGRPVPFEFSIARRVNTPWEAGLYFSKAHMPTQAHIQALELLDGLLATKG